MEFNVIEETKTKLVVDFKGEDHTLCNILKEELNNDDKVKTATYFIEHPSIGIPRMVIETSGKAPRDALLDAIKRLKKRVSDFKKAAEKQVK